MSTPIISLQQVSKQFLVPHQKRTTLKESFINIFKPNVNEKFHALKEISLEISHGEFIGIIGPNGSGKSTLLKLLANIYSPDSGRISVRGAVAPLLELGIGFHPELSARENIYLNAALLGLSHSQTHRRFNSIVDFAEIGHFIDLKIKNFSSGMRSRLAFAIARELDADIYLCDEVFAVGDAGFQKKCLETFESWKEEGKTIILVTHSLDFIREYADRAFYLKNGQLLAEGRPSDVITAYQNPAEILPDFSNSPARITSVEVLQSDPATNSPLTIRVNYHSREKIENPVFGLAIHKSDGQHITGPNTKTSQFQIPQIHGQGFLDIEIEKLPLLAGKYLISASIFDNNLSRPFDYLDKYFLFTVKPNNANQYGLIEISPKWTHHPAQIHDQGI